MLCNTTNNKHSQICKEINHLKLKIMKKVFMSFLMAAGISGMAIGQATQSPSTQSQSSTSPSMQSDKESKDGWQKIGEKSFDLSKDKDELTFNTNEKFTAIKFKAKDGTVNLSNVELQYEDDSKQIVNLESAIRAESESKVVSLNNTDKKLDKVTFNFKKDAGMAAGQAGKAKVEVWGLKDKSGTGMGSRSGSQSGSGIDHSSSDTSMMDHSMTPGSSKSGQGSQYDHSGTKSTPGSTTPGSSRSGQGSQYDQSAPGSTTPGSTTPGSTTPGSTTPGSGTTR